MDRAVEGKGQEAGGRKREGEPRVVGDRRKPNLAASRQGIAGTGRMVVIADGVRRLLGNLFESRI